MMKNMMKHFKKILAGVILACTLGACAVPAYAYDFGADEYAKRMAPLVTTNDAGQTIYVNYLPDGSWAGWHQDGYKMMAVVEPCGTKGVIYIDTSACGQKISFDSIGLTELKEIIKFEDGSAVKKISIGDAYALDKLIYSYKVTAVSTGVRKWGFSQSMTFQDESGDTYKLGMMKSGAHDVRYNSKAPKIAVITWGY